MSTLYPNILAEYRASGFSLFTLAQHANVTEELMEAVLEKNEKLGINELQGLCGLFNNFSGRHNVILLHRLNLTEFKQHRKWFQSQRTL